MELLVLLIVWSLAVYRLTRLIVLDTIFDAPRDAFHDFLLGMPPENPKDQGRMSRWLWKRRPRGKRAKATMEWLHKLTACPYCISVWVSAAVLFTHRLFVASFPMPVWMWLATAAATLIWYRIVDSDS